MRTLTTVLSMAFAAILLGQAPQAFDFQGVARDASGNVLSSQPIALRVSILVGSPAGAAAYQETHGLTTSPFGLFTIQVGQGTPTQGTFPGIGWSSSSHYLQVEMDATGGTSFINLGASQLLSVPYALHAKATDCFTVSLTGDTLFQGNGCYVIIPGISAANGGCADADGDGYYDQEGCGTLVDCDDSNPNVYPGALEVCDGVDNSCDGQTDEGDVCASCVDGIQNGLETDVDCGGPECAPCVLAQGCNVNSDCGPGLICQGGTCVTGCPPAGTSCDDGNACTFNDMEDGACNCTGGPVNCDDGDLCTTDICDPQLGCLHIPNCCTDGVMNGQETGVDCGGPDCPPCAQGQGCVVNSDCGPGLFCQSGTCVCPAPGTACDDGDPCTTNDQHDGNCNCVGNPVVDADGDGFTICTGDCDDTNASIYPGAADLPDMSFIDSNCDGIDGDVAGSIFVSPTGNDANPGTMAQPRQTIQAGIAAALAQSKPSVLVAAGVYNTGSGLVLSSNIGVYGGYNASTWARSTSNTTLVQGTQQAVLANGTSNVKFQLLTIQAFQGGGHPSVYGIRAVSSTGLVVEGCTVSAGNGAAGTAGSNGSAGSSGAAGIAGMNGACNGLILTTGGSGGVGSGNSGGNGGSGGQGQNAGLAGSNGFGIAGGAFGGGGNFGDPGQPGSNGQVGGAGALGTNGSPGGSVLGSVTFGLWAGANGGSGTNGSVGSGGGGGGGGGGQYCVFGCGTHGTGNSGGGGGAGGNGGTLGSGGTFGGGSFGIFLSNSTVTVTASQIQAGNGGAGGAGGVGGAGGAGGAGGLGPNLCTNEVGKGGNGGSGGNGGAGGHGAGGTGGASIAIYRGGTSTATAPGSVLLTGSPGAGGAGVVPGNNGVAGTILP